MKNYPFKFFFPIELCVRTGVTGMHSNKVQLKIILGIDLIFSSSSILIELFQEEKIQFSVFFRPTSLPYLKVKSQPTSREVVATLFEGWSNKK